MNTSDSPEISASLAELHHKITSIEPIARDLNRHLTDMLGACPVGDTGSWVVLVEDNAGNILLQLPTLPSKEALRISTAFNVVATYVQPSKIKSAIPTSTQYELPFIIDVVSSPKVSGHVKVGY